MPRLRFFVPEVLLSPILVLDRSRPTQDFESMMTIATSPKLQVLIGSRFCQYVQCPRCSTARTFNRLCKDLTPAASTVLRPRRSAVVEINEHGSSQVYICVNAAAMFSGTLFALSWIRSNKTIPVRVCCGFRSIQRRERNRFPFQNEEDVVSAATTFGPEPRPEVHMIARSLKQRNARYRDRFLPVLSSWTP